MYRLSLYGSGYSIDRRDVSVPFLFIDPFSRFEPEGPLYFVTLVISIFYAVRGRLFKRAFLG